MFPLLVKFISFFIVFRKYKTLCKGLYIENTIADTKEQSLPSNDIKSDRVDKSHIKVVITEATSKNKGFEVRQA